MSNNYEVQKTILSYHRNYPGLLWGAEKVSDDDFVEIVERENIPSLVEKIQQFQNFITPSNYWYTVEELTDLLLDYSFYLRTNRESLIRTGLPDTKFNRSEWIDFSFTNTYPVKLPANFYGQTHPRIWISDEYKGKVETDNNGYPFYDYYWVREDVLSEDIDELLHGDYSFTECFDFAKVDYSQAACISTLSEEEIKFIEEFREKLVGLKIALIDKIIELQEEGGERLMEDAVSLFADYINYDKFAFLLDIESKLVESGLDEYFTYFHEAASLQYFSEEFKEMPDKTSYIERPAFWNLIGGIRGIFYFIMYIEKELNLRRIDTIKKEFIKTFPMSKHFEKRYHNDRAIGKLDDGTLLCSYYQVTNSEKRSAVDRILDKDKELFEREKRYWKKRSFETSRLLEEDLKREYNITVQLKKRYEQKFFSYLEKYIETKIEYLNIYGDLPGVKQDKEEHADKPYLFRKAGEGFEVVFNGKPSFFLKETVGLNYIHIMMTNRNKIIPIQDLVYFNKNAGEQNVHVDNYSDALEKGRSVSSKAYSSEDLKTVVGKLRELLEEKNEANEFGNYDKAEELQYKIESLQDYIREAQSRKQDPELEKMRTSVKNAINSAIRKIKKYDVDLAQHFEEKISTGYTCIYTLSPSDNVEWAFQR